MDGQLAVRSATACLRRLKKDNGLWGYPGVPPDCGAHYLPSSEGCGRSRPARKEQEPRGTTSWSVPLQCTRPDRSFCSAWTGRVASRCSYGSGFRPGGEVDEQAGPLPLTRDRVTLKTVFPGLAFYCAETRGKVCGHLTATTRPRADCPDALPPAPPPTVRMVVHGANVRQHFLNKAAFLERKAMAKPPHG